MDKKVVCKIIREHIDLFFNDILGIDTEISEKSNLILFTAFLMACKFLCFEDTELDYIIYEYLGSGYSKEKVEEIQYYYNKFADAINETDKHPKSSFLSIPDYVWAKTIMQLLDRPFEFEIQIAIAALQKSFYDEIVQIQPPKKSDILRATNEDDASNLLKNTKSSIRYCKHCGGEIDQNKKCTKCGKKYFHLNSFKLLAAFALLITISFGISINTLIQQKSLLDSQAQAIDSIQVELQNTQSELNNLTIKYDAEIDQALELFEIIDIANELIRFYVNNAVIVTENDGYFHRYGCSHISDSPFLIYNIANARKKGYLACNDCWLGAALMNLHGLNPELDIFYFMPE